MPSLAPVIKQRFTDSNGNPFAGGKLWCYLAGTSTPRATYSDSLSTPNTNPVILDANGEADVWIGVGYFKFVLMDENDVVIWTVDQVSLPSGAAVAVPDGGTTDQVLYKLSDTDNDCGWKTLAKADVGLSNVDNTSDADKNAATATLTNKTLTSPVINSPTGLVKADVGLDNVDNTSDATKDAATATLTNKTFGNKTTFNAEIVGASAIDATAGAAQTLPLPATLIVNLTGALTTLSGITAGVDSQILILVNKTSADRTIKNEDATATAANRIITGTGSDLTFKDTASLWFVYDATSARWRIVGGSGGGGSVEVSAEQTLNNLDAIALLAVPLQRVLIKMSGANDNNKVTLPDGTIDTQRVYVVCTAADETFIIENGGNVIQNGNIEFNLGKIVCYHWVAAMSKWLAGRE